MLPCPRTHTTRLGAFLCLKRRQIRRWLVNTFNMWEFR